MAWNEPRTWTDGETLTPSLFKDELVSNINHLKGKDGSVEIEGNITFPNTETVDGVDLSAHDTGDAKTQHTAGIGDHNHESPGAQGGQVATGAFSGRMTLSQLPAGADGSVWIGQGAGNDSEYIP